MDITHVSRPSIKIARYIFGGGLLTIFLGLTLYAYGAEPIAPRLTPKLQKFLAEEMTATLQASREIVAALAAGDDATVAKQAQAIHDSFILDKNLTTKDRHDLDAAVPTVFLELDDAFHQMAAKLAAAARHKDRDLQQYYFGRMLETCQACHAKYATDKFPAFGGETPVTHSH